MISDVSIDVHTPDDGVIHTRFDSRMDWPTPRVNETVPFTFWFDANDTDGNVLAVESGETYTVESETTEAFLQTTVESGGTLTQEAGSTLITASDRAGLYPGFTTLRAYGDFAGAFDAGFDARNRPWYREQLPSGAKSSLVLGIEPSTALKEQLVPGVWGLVESMSDRRNPALSWWALDVEVRVLSRFEQYDSVSDVQADLEA